MSNSLHSATLVAQANTAAPAGQGALAPAPAVQQAAGEVAQQAAGAAQQTADALHSAAAAMPAAASLWVCEFSAISCDVVLTSSVMLAMRADAA